MGTMEHDDRDNQLSIEEKYMRFYHSSSSSQRGIIS